MIKFILKITYILLLVGVSSISVFAQKEQIQLKQADVLKGGNRNGESLNRVIGNVIFQQKETTIYSDSAYFFNSRNYIEAYGHVKIIEGDSVTITAKKLVYDGNLKEAKLRENVVFVKKGELTLYTDYLDYFRMQQEARYYNGGKIVDSTNVLTSKKGYYQVNTNMASFKSDVKAVNPDYTLTSDTLQYNTSTNIIYFRAHTEIVDSENNKFNYETGQYDTKIKKSDLNIGQVETPEYVMSGDNLNLDDLQKLYRAKGNVVLVSKENDVIITGDDGFYKKRDGISKVYGNALMKKVMKNDTLYLTADTLVAIESEIASKKRLLAYNNVKIFKSDLQGVADSLAYFTSDSTIFFYDDPVLWSSDTQMEADSINAEISNGTINRLNLNLNSFVISEDSISNYNQIKGRSMVAYFDSGNINKVDVNGNAESLFFALNDNSTALMGMNKIICSFMIINFKLNKVDNLSSYVNPEASFVPPHELEEPQRKLKDFRWRIEEKPEKEAMLEGTSAAKKTTPVTKPDVIEQKPEKPVRNKNLRKIDSQ